MASRRLLQTTGAVYYGTTTFTYPLNIYDYAPVPALPPGTTVTVGYDFTCLLKDIRKTNCAGMTVSVWSVMASLVAIVMVFCIVLIPIACIYRSGRFAGKSLHKMMKGHQDNPYAEIEQRAEANSQDMPMPPSASNYRTNGFNRAGGADEEDWEQ